jgi:hypothetical protein
VVELKETELSPDLDSDSKNNKRRHIIDVEPIATATTTTIQPKEPEDPEEGEHLFHSKMWVKGTPLHFIVDNRSQKNLILAEVIKQLDLSTTPHPQPYNIGWLARDDIFVSANSVIMSYDIKPFKDEVLCDVFPLEVCNVLLGQPYMWRRHVVYESRPRSVIVTLGCHPYMIPEVVLTTVPTKKFRKVSLIPQSLASSQSSQKRRTLQPL